MNSGIAARVDMRVFKWPLAGLQKKLEHELDLARLELASLNRELAASEAEIRAMQQEQHAQAQAMGCSRALAMEPSAHRQGLEYLRRELEQLSQRSRHVAGLRQRIEEAQARCAAADRRLAAMRRSRASAEAGYATTALRKDAKEADLAWLAYIAPRQRPTRLAPGRP
jgi:DNA repair ATPase RecN